MSNTQQSDYEFMIYHTVPTYREIKQGSETGELWHVMSRFKRPLRNALMIRVLKCRHDLKNRLY